MDAEDHEWRSRYRLCRAGFSLLALGLGLLCLADTVLLLAIFRLAPDVAKARETPTWFWLVDAPIPWTTLIGSMLLIGQWKQPFWQGRAVLLTVLNGVDAATWTLSNADRLGIPPGVGLGSFGWAVYLMTLGFGWFELLLAASLAAAVCAHLGAEAAQRRHQTAQMLGAIGVSLWFIFALTQTNWAAWPPRGNFPDQAGRLLHLTAIVVRALTCFQIALLSLMASRQCRQYLVEWDRHEAADPFAKRPGPDRDEIDVFPR
jgi:hypothetical protein